MPVLATNTTVTINPCDINDNRPSWPSDPITFNWPENAIPGIVGTLRAADADHGTRGKVQYSLVNTTAAALQGFLLSGSDSQGLLFRQVADREVQAEYSVEVRATDGFPVSGGKLDCTFSGLPCLLCFACLDVDCTMSNSDVIIAVSSTLRLGSDLARYRVFLRAIFAQFDAEAPYMRYCCAHILMLLLSSILCL